MQGAQTEITNYLDEKISELAKSRLPEAPEYRFGNSHYASFMMPRDGTFSGEGDSDHYVSGYNAKPTSSTMEHNKETKFGQDSRDGYVS